MFTITSIVFCLLFQGPGTPGTPATPYQILTPAFYDQSGQLMVGNGRGLATPVRLISPAPVIVNAQQSQQSWFKTNYIPIIIILHLFVSN